MDISGGGGPLLCSHTDYLFIPLLSWRQALHPWDTLIFVPQGGSSVLCKSLHRGGFSLSGQYWLRVSRRILTGPPPVSLLIPCTLHHAILLQKRKWKYEKGKAPHLWPPVSQKEPEIKHSHFIPQWTYTCWMLTIMHAGVQMRSPSMYLQVSQETQLPHSNAFLC